MNTNLNPRNLLLWITDLETTNVKQGKNWLQQDGAYCCLGRLCEVAISQGVQVRVTVHDGRSVYDGEDDEPPEAVGAWLGIDGDGLIVDTLSRYFGPATPTEANDKLDMSFRDIAKGLRSHYAQELATLEEGPTES